MQGVPHSLTCQVLRLLRTTCAWVHCDNNTLSRPGAGHIYGVTQGWINIAKYSRAYAKIETYRGPSIASARTIDVTTSHFQLIVPLSYNPWRDITNRDRLTARMRNLETGLYSASLAHAKPAHSRRPSLQTDTLEVRIWFFRSIQRLHRLGYCTRL